MIKLFLFILTFNSITYAIDTSKCSQMLNEGWFKKYKFGGIGEQVNKAMTQETKRAGSSTGSTNITTEGTTAISDPGYTSNVLTSETQSTSSWGECSAFALKTMQKQQELYFDQNQMALNRQIALNQDGHLQALASFNLCDNSAYELFKKMLRSEMPDLIESKNGHDFVIKVKEALGKDKQLKTACYANYIS